MELIIIVWLLCAALSAWVGTTKGQMGTGLLLGLLFGIFGLLGMLAWPSDRTPCPYCAEKINKKATLCPHCHSELA
jgi:membrane associated rhomboid family serine protease